MTSPTNNSSSLAWVTLTNAPNLSFRLHVKGFLLTKMTAKCTIYNLAQLAHKLIENCSDVKFCMQICVRLFVPFFGKLKSKCLMFTEAECSKLEFSHFTSSNVNTITDNHPHNNTSTTWSHFKQQETKHDYSSLRFSDCQLLLSIWWNRSNAMLWTFQL